MLSPDSDAAAPHHWAFLPPIARFAWLSSGKQAAKIQNRSAGADFCEDWGAHSPATLASLSLSKRISVHFVSLGLSLGAAIFALSPRQALAQACGSTDDVHSSYPADGAPDVPTNAPIFVYGPELAIGAHDVVLEDASGEAVEFDVLAVEGGLHIDAFLGFAPRTTYEVTLTARQGGEVWSASFTTGSGPAGAVQHEAPDVSVSVINQDRGTCGVVSAICVNGLIIPARMTLEVLVGGEVLSLGSSATLPPAFPAGGGNIAANGCVDLRVREPGGTVSQATRLCGSQLTRYELAANAAAPTSCASYPPAPEATGGDDDESESESESESGGCSLTAPGAASSAGGLLLGVTALLLARQRRRAR